VRLGEREERPLWDSTGRKSFLPAEKHLGEEFEKPFVRYNFYKRRSDPYQREARITSRTILLSTLGSLVSLSFLLFYMPHNR
jgi:hypothetical protein